MCSNQASKCQTIKMLGTGQPSCQTSGNPAVNAREPSFEVPGTQLWSASIRDVTCQATELPSALQPSRQVPANQFTMGRATKTFSASGNQAAKCRASCQVPGSYQVLGNQVQLLPSVRKVGNKWLMVGKDISEPPVREGVKTIKLRPVLQLLPLLYPVILAKVLI